MIVRALHYPATQHIALRLRRLHAKISLWYDTFPKLFEILGIKEMITENKSDLFFEVKNKSRIWIDGLDDKDRVEKILGREYATIFLNEASQIGYDSYDLLTTRGNAPKGMPFRFFIDYNPPSKKHWGYKIFHEQKFPDGRPVPINDYKYIKINPIDNKINLSDGYLDKLNNLTGLKKIRFKDGEYGEEEGSLWKRNWFRYKSAPEELVRVVIGVDPSGSLEGDEIGIIPVGIDKENDIYILDDLSLHGTPKQWSDEVFNGYTKYNADVITAEKNFGGEMVQSTITDMGRRIINIKLVNASRGKIVRAEPIASLYEKGKIYHTKQFIALEDELCLYKPDTSESPNRMDALVWAVTELIDLERSTILVS